MRKRCLEASAVTYVLASPPLPLLLPRPATSLWTPCARTSCISLLTPNALLTPAL